MFTKNDVSGGRDHGVQKSEGHPLPNTSALRLSRGLHVQRVERMR